MNSLRLTAPAPLRKPAVSLARTSPWARRSAHSPVCASVCDRSFWRNKLGQVPLRLDLPFVKRTAADQAAPAFVSFEIGAELTERLRSFARDEVTTPFSVMLAAWNLVLARQSGQRSFVVGCAFPGGKASIPDAPLLVCAEVDMQAGFRALVRATADARAEAANHSDLDLDGILAALGGVGTGPWHPIFQTAFAERQSMMDQPSRALTTTDRQPCELACIWQQRGSTIVGRIEFLDGVADAEAVQRLAVQLGSVLRAGLMLPDAPVGTLGR